MRLSPAPAAHNSSGLRPVAAAGAGVQFVTGPIHGMRVTVRDCLPALTMQNGTGTGSVAFNFQGIAGRGKAGRVQARPGTATTRAWRGIQAQFSVARLDVASRGAAVRGMATRYPERNLGQFPKESPVTAWRGLAMPGEVRLGYTSPGTEIPDIFPSTKKLPHHAGQRLMG